MRKILLLLAMLLPGPFKRFIYRRFFGWKIGKNVHIGFSYLNAREVVIGDNVRIRHLNTMTQVSRLILGHDIYIANFNHFSGNDHDGKWTATLIIGSHVNIMSRHFIDLGGTVTIGDWAIMAGRDTHIWSHGIFVDGDDIHLTPTDVTISDHVYIGARSTILGVNIPQGAVVGAGAVVTKSFPAEADRILLAGNPAVIRKRYPRPVKGASDTVPATQS